MDERTIRLDGNSTYATPRVLAGFAEKFWPKPRRARSSSSLASHFR
jgi:hypothetical protein